MKYRLKRQYLVLATIIITILVGLFVQLMISRTNDIKKEVQACDIAYGRTCTYYEYRLFHIHNN